MFMLAVFREVKGACRCLWHGVGLRFDLPGGRGQGTAAGVFWVWHSVQPDRAAEDVLQNVPHVVPGHPCGSAHGLHVFWCPGALITALAIPVGVWVGARRGTPDGVLWRG